MFSLASESFETFLPDEQPAAMSFAPLRYRSFDDLERPEPVDVTWFKASRVPTPEVLPPVEQGFAAAVQQEPSKPMTGRISPIGLTQKRGRRWTDDEDAVLMDVVSQFGQNWKDISLRFPGKTSKQIKERWSNQLDPRISDKPWSAEDDFQLVSLIREFGRSWCRISKTMLGRTELMLKNRYHSFLRKKLNPEVFDGSGKMTKDEEYNIKNKLNKFPRRQMISSFSSSQASTAANSPTNLVTPAKSFKSQEWSSAAIL